MVPPCMLMSKLIKLYMLHTCKFSVYQVYPNNIKKSLSAAVCHTLGSRCWRSSWGGASQRLETSFPLQKLAGSDLGPRCKAFSSWDVYLAPSIDKILHGANGQRKRIFKWLSSIFIELDKFVTLEQRGYKSIAGTHSQAFDFQN